MSKFYASQMGHIVNVLPPINAAGGKVGDRFHMKKHSHVTVIVQIGVSAAAATKLIIKECDAASAGTANEIATGKAKIYKEETAAGDTLDSGSDYPNGGVTPSANDNIMYVIELDADDLTDGYPWVEVSLTNASGNSVIASMVAIQSGARYGFNANDTTIA